MSFDDDPRAGVARMENLVDERGLELNSSTPVDADRLLLESFDLVAPDEEEGFILKRLLDEPVSMSNLHSLQSFINALNEGQFEVLSRFEVPKPFHTGRWFSIEGASAAIATYEEIQPSTRAVPHAGLGFVRWGRVESLGEQFCDLRRVTVFGKVGLHLDTAVQSEWAGFKIGRGGESFGDGLFCSIDPYPEPFVTKREYIMTLADLLMASLGGEDDPNAALLFRLFSREFDSLKKEVKKRRARFAKAKKAARTALLVAAVPFLIGSADVEKSDLDLPASVNLTEQSYE